MIFSCKHKYGKIDGSYQYCEKCGVAKSAPIIECGHKWAILNTITATDIMTKRYQYTNYTMRCDKCGDIKTETTQQE